jgi:hypothetical protein
VHEVGVGGAVGCADVDFRLLDIDSARNGGQDHRQAAAEVASRMARSPKISNNLHQRRRRRLPNNC